MGTEAYKQVLLKGCRIRADAMNSNRERNKNIFDIDPK